jgi:hypothetical protein
MTIINQRESSTEYLRKGRNVDVQRGHDRGDVDASMDNTREILSLISREGSLAI